MSAGGQAASQPVASSAQQESWFLKSRFYDPVCTSPVVLQELQSRLRCDDAPLRWLETNGRNISFREIDVATHDSRQRAEADLESTSPHARVFFLSHIFEHLAPNGMDPKQSGIMRFSIGIGANALSWFFHHQEIHPMFLEALNSHVQHALYETLDQNSKLSHLHLCVKLPPAGHLEAAFYIRFDTSTNRIVAIVAGNDLDSHFRILAEHLQRNGPPQGPFSLASLLITRYFYFLESQRIQIDHKVIMIERQTGRGAVAYSGGQAPQTIAPEDLDLTQMHWIEGNQRNIVGAAECQLRLASFLLDEHMQYIQQRNNTNFERHKLSGIERAIYERLKSHKQLVEGLFASSRTTRERIQRQLSAVDSIINQSDNKVSLKNAAASTKIAEQSRRIAEETRRDSTSMKTIASLTMVYLPSTFAATVFGTGFFTYQVGDETIFRVSAQIWKLIVTALVLSALTVGIWVWVNRYGVPKHLEWARQTEAKRLADEQIELQDLGSN